MEDIASKMNKTMHIGSNRNPNMKIPRAYLHESKARWNDALLGCIFTDDELNQEEVLGALRVKWKFGKRLEVLFHPRNRFVIRYEKQMERTRLIREQPWSLLGHLMFFKPFDQGTTPSEVQFSQSPLWLSFSGLRLEHELPKIVTIIAAAAGEVLEVYPSDSSLRPTDGFRAKVLVQIDQPLVQGAYADTIDSGYVWVSFHYLGLPYYYCNTCFSLGHTSSTCVTTHQTPEVTHDLLGSSSANNVELSSHSTERFQNVLPNSSHETETQILTNEELQRMKSVKGKNHIDGTDSLMFDEVMWSNNNPLAEIFGDKAEHILGTNVHNTNPSPSNPIAQQGQLFPHQPTVISTQPNLTEAHTEVYSSPKQIQLTEGLYPTRRQRGRPPLHGPRRYVRPNKRLPKHTPSPTPLLSPQSTQNSSSSSLRLNNLMPIKKRKYNTVEESVTLMEAYHPSPPMGVEMERNQIIQASARSTYSIDLISDLIANPEVQSILMAQGISIQPMWGEFNSASTTQTIRNPTPEEALMEINQQEVVTIDEFGTFEARAHRSSFSSRQGGTHGISPYTQIPGSLNPTLTQKRRNAELKARKEAAEKKRALNVLANNDVRYRKYTIDEIEIATERFSESLKIGEGGYGPVFRASLDHTLVAIKVLRADAAQGKRQFQQEVEVLSCIRHPNMVLLLGACPEYGCLVYEYMDHGSLEDRLFRRGDSPAIPWQIRFKISAEIATALLFLHQTKPEPLVHRDLKPANILLDRNYVSKISDVGLARLVPPSIADSVTQYHMTSAAGTFCYIDPEYQQTGMLGIKSDIYSLGIMLLQIITAKPAMGLSHHVSRAIEKGNFSELLDPTIPDCPLDEAISFAKLALNCAELRRKDRPDLGSVILPELNRLRNLGCGEGSGYHHAFAFGQRSQHSYHSTSNSSHLSSSHSSHSTSPASSNSNS